MPNITARILTDTVLKVKEGNGFYYRAKIIVTLNDGQELEYAVKTKLNSYTAETVLTKANGDWVNAQLSEIVTLVTGKFFIFLNLMKDCFFSKYARNQLFLKRNRLLRDNTPSTDRMAYSSRITDALYLIDGRLVQVKHMVRNKFEGKKAVYFEMPLDLSTDWVEIDYNSQLHAQCLSAGSEYRRGLCDYNSRKYHKELVNTGIRM